MKDSHFWSLYFRYNKMQLIDYKPIIDSYVQVEKFLIQLLDIAEKRSNIAPFFLLGGLIQTEQRFFG